jgi:hypothetical protein
MKSQEENLDSFIEGMYEASVVLTQENPDYIVASMSGSVPFIDAMHIVNDSFDISKVVYMPASSRINNVNQVIREWYFNFLTDVEPHKDFPKVMGIDEVVSGGSVVRCLKNIDIASNNKRKSRLRSLTERLISKDEKIVESTLNEIDDLTEHDYNFDLMLMKQRFRTGEYTANPDLARNNFGFLSEIIKNALASHYTYRTIGIEDSKAEGKRNKEYETFKEARRVIPIEVSTIISMDIPDFTPPRFKQVESNVKTSGKNYVQYSPFVESFVVTPRYLGFLQQIAKRVGKNPDLVDPVNFNLIMNSNKYLSSQH